jgi:pimeloyl-ACP methyl ester carboxylesterase
VTTEPPAAPPAAHSAWPQAEQAIAGGQRFALYRLGPADSPAAPSALLLHEPGRTASRWKQVAPALADDRQLLVPDLPGNGDTEEGPRTLSATVAALVDLVSHEGGGQPLDVVGSGPGATLGIAMAAARADLVRRLVVIGGGWPAMLPAGPDQEPRGHPAGEWLRAQVCRFRGEADWKSEPTPASWLLPRPERSLIIWGARDRVLLPLHGERVLSALGRCVDPATVTMVTVPGAGHRVLDEASADLTALLREFLRAP